MGVAKTVDKEITYYLGHLSTKQKEVVLSVVKTFAGEEDRWNDKAYIAEMDRRVAEMENGEVKGHTWEDVKQRARQSPKLNKRK